LSILDDFTDGIPVETMSSESQEEIGRIASAKVDNAVSTFEKIRSELLVRNENEDGSSTPPPYEELLMDEGHYEEIIAIHEIITRYSSHDYSTLSPTINQDVVKLSAFIVRLSTVLGYSKGIASNADHNYRLMRSRYHIQIREIAEEMGLKMSDTAAEQMARVQARDWQESESYYTIVHEMLSALYFSALAFVRVLEGAAQRLHHELYTKI